MYFLKESWLLLGRIFFGTFYWNSAPFFGTFSWFSALIFGTLFGIRLKENGYFYQSVAWPFRDWGHRTSVITCTCIGMWNQIEFRPSRLNVKKTWKSYMQKSRKIMVFFFVEKCWCSAAIKVFSLIFYNIFMKELNVRPGPSTRKTVKNSHAKFQKIPRGKIFFAPEKYDDRITA